MGTLFGRRNNVIGMIFQHMKIGFPILFVSTMILVILQILSGYKTNKIFLNTEDDY